MKYLSLFVVLCISFISINVYADTEPIPIVGSPISNGSEIKTGSERTLLRIPIEVWLDSEAMTISIEYFGEDDGVAYLYDSSGNIEDSSPSLNSTLNLPSSGNYTLYMATDAWEATAHISI